MVKVTEESFLPCRYIRAGRKRSVSQGYIFAIGNIFSILLVALDTVKPNNLVINMLSNSEIYMKISNFSKYVHLVPQESCWFLTSLLIVLKS